MKLSLSRLLSLLLFAFAAELCSADDFQDLSTRAAAARDANDVAQAVALYRKALDINPQWQEGWWFLGTLLYDSDQYAPGRDAFQHFVDLNAQAAPGWAFLGLCEFEQGDYARALKDVERGLALGADKETQLAPVLSYHEALLLTREGEFDHALEKYAALTRAMQGTSPNKSLLVSIGLAALRTPLLPKDVAPAQEELYVLAGKATSFIFAAEYSQADATFRELLARYGQTANVHYMHGVYLMARDPDEAFREFQRELEIFPSSAAANKMLAWGLLTRGDSEAALPYAEKAAKAPETAVFGEYLLGRALVETGDVRRGLPLLEKAEAEDASNWDTHIALAAAYSRAGRPQQARRERELAMHMDEEGGAVAQR